MIISHGHSDHSGGEISTGQFKARVLPLGRRLGISLTADAVPAGARHGRDRWPEADARRHDNYDAITPGHTAGTLSYLIPVKDHGTPHLVAEWGGTAFNFPRTPENFKAYTASAIRFGEIATKAGADVLISNHSEYDGSKTKLPALKLRKPGDPNPYVVGTDSVKRYMKIAEECSKAWELRVAK